MAKKIEIVGTVDGKINGTEKYTAPANHFVVGTYYFKPNNSTAMLFLNSGKFVTLEGINYSDGYVKYSGILCKLVDVN